MSATAVGPVGVCHCAVGLVGCRPLCSGAGGVSATVQWGLGDCSGACGCLPLCSGALGGPLCLELIVGVHA